MARSKRCATRVYTAPSGFDPNHIFIHKDDQTLEVLKRPFPIANRLKSDDPMHEITQVTGPGPYGPEVSAERDGSNVGSLWLPGALQVALWLVLGMVHFDWYVSVDEKNHRYFIAWGTQVKPELPS